LDILQATVLAVLLLVLFLSFFLMGKKAISEFLKSYRTQTVRRLTLADFVIILVFMPTILASGMGAFWVIYVGLEGLPRVLLLSGGGAFVMTVVMLSIFYITNAISRREMEKKSKKKSQTGQT